MAALLRCILHPSDYQFFLILLGAKHRQIGGVFWFFSETLEKLGANNTVQVYFFGVSEAKNQCIFDVLSPGEPKQVLTDLVSTEGKTNGTQTD